jgi:hypothetical protein
MFPYLAPLKDWTVDVLKDREANKIDGMLMQPWCILTSGAKVIKDTLPEDAEAIAAKFKDLVSNGSAGGYSGCIIKNNIDSQLNYSLNETIVGIDFDGKLIKVPGETNRRISTPIIESVDIDTDGANNTLKTARINVRCFSLKQLEMFEMFFMKPGMNVLFEYGSNILERKTYPLSKDAGSPKPFTSVTQAIIPKNDYRTFINTFSDYYKVDTKNLKEYLKRIESSRGTYDLVAGKVTDYSFSIDANGTYSVMLEVSQGNQMTLAIPINIDEKKSIVPGQSKDKGDELSQYFTQMASDMNLDSTKLKNTIPNARNEFFNWGKLNNEKKDESANSTPYISLRFILTTLINYSIDGGVDDGTFQFELPTYKVDGKDEQIIPIRIHKNLISSSDEVIFPNKSLPKFTGDKDGNNIVIDDRNRIDGSINGYSVEDSRKIAMERANKDIVINETNTAVDDGLRNGNALNIFVKYKTVVEAWKKSYTKGDFLEGILDIINANSYGLFRLGYHSQVTGGKATIIDIKSTNKDIPTDVYRFKPTTINSIVRDFTFNFEMSNLVAGRTVFNAQRTLIEAYKKTKPEERKIIGLPANAYKEYDSSMFANRDGYYSVNLIDLEALKKTYEDMIDKKTTVKADDDKPAEAKNLSEIIDSKSIKFKVGKDNLVVLIYNDLEFIRTQVKSVELNSKSILTPIEVTITISGLSGFSCGEYFHIDGVPEMYNHIGVFQITNTKHSITPEGWETTLEAGFRIKPSK